MASLIGRVKKYCVDSGVVVSTEEGNIHFSLKPAVSLGLAEKSVKMSWIEAKAGLRVKITVEEVTDA